MVGVEIQRNGVTVCIAPPETVDELTALLNDIARLRRIEAAARAHIEAWDAGDTFAHDTRAALREALKEGATGNV